MIALRHLHDATEKEIAKKFNLNLNTVKSKINRDLAIMKNNYEEMK